MAKKETHSELTREMRSAEREIVRLLGERAKTALKLAKLREADGKPLLDPAEESETIQRMLEQNKGPLTERAVRAVGRELISGSRALIKPTRVAYLGPQYSYSHIAAIERFGQSVEFHPVATIATVFEAVHSGRADFGIVPIENSTDGRIVDTLDMFAKVPAKISGEVQLRIHHNLLGKCSQADVQEVYSKPQALSQCRDWISKHLPHARAIEMTSTAAAAQLAADRPYAAAVASQQAAANYGLNVIAPHIEDNKHNVTRFAVIGETPSRRTGHDKTALMLEIPHRPGALADALTIFKRYKLNLTWIESFPMPGAKNEYLFFVEFVGHESEAKAVKAMLALKRKTIRLDVLGSYEMREPVE